VILGIAIGLGIAILCLVFFLAGYGMADMKNQESDTEEMEP